ncbi:MAG: transcriptional regulator [Actinomycetota bacterium]|nr:transcriptional regulator [Actinomycetota bacterium]
MSDDSVASVLLLLRLKAFSPSLAIAERLELPHDHVEAELERCSAAGWVQLRTGLAAGWSLTPSGRRHGEQLLRAEVDAAGTRAQLEACYLGFLPLNSELLAVCTDWQTMPVDGDLVPNDHSDDVRDAAVLDRLEALHRRSMPVLDALADTSARFVGFGDRLTRAHDHVAAGRTEWIAKPTVDSYHGVWFELHEQLLVTLGRERSTEPLPQYVPTTTGPITQNGDSE